jgi:hypothetical protein
MWRACSGSNHQTHPPPRLVNVERSRSTPLSGKDLAPMGGRLTMYCADKYVHSERSTLNDRVIRSDPDDTFTLHSGSQPACGEVANSLDTPGDNCIVRIYRPVEAIIKGG